MSKEQIQKIISETSLTSGLATIENRFVIEGHYKYTFNNGHLAKTDPKAAATNFLNALEKIPGIISQRKEKKRSVGKGYSATARTGRKSLEKGR